MRSGPRDPAPLKFAGASPLTGHMQTPLDPLSRGVGSSAPSRWLTWVAPIAASLVTGSTQSGALLPVSATVAPHAAISVHAPSEFVVSTTDLARGYVTVDEPSELKLVSNYPQGVALDVTAPRGLFAAMYVKGGDIDAQLPGEGGTLTFRWPSPQPSIHSLSVELHFRLVPAPGLQPGTYSWPIQLHGRALETGAGQ